MSRSWRLHRPVGTRDNRHMAAAGLVGRDEELAAIGTLIAERRGGGLLLSGEPGIGKTVLWEAGVEQAREAGWTVP
jgi:MoxR-like ATPase